MPQTIYPFILPNPAQPSLLPLWKRWVAANALSELLGLGLVAAIGGGLVWRFGEPHTVFLILLFALLMILLGAVEGLIIGLAQWLAVSPFFRSLSRRDWVKATIYGAVIAWGLGMIPSTFFALQDSPHVTPDPPVNDMLKYWLAAVMGLGLGAALGVPQWLVLRRQLWRASWWVGANAIAWAIGMPIIFWGAGAVPEQPEGWQVVSWLALTLSVAGAAVGAIHGCALIWLLRHRAWKRNLPRELEGGAQKGISP